MSSNLKADPKVVDPMGSQSAKGAKCRMAETVWHATEEGYLRGRGGGEMGMEQAARKAGSEKIWKWEEWGRRRRCGGARGMRRDRSAGEALRRRGPRALPNVRVP